MKRKLIYCLGVMLVVVAVWAVPQDPFESQGAADWEGFGLREKPYQLEIAYGEWERTAPTDSAESSSPVEPDFLAAATRLAIAISGDEAGDFQEIGKHRIRYRISGKEGGRFDLRIGIDIDRVAEGEGLYGVNTSVTLEASEWVVVSSRSEKTPEGAQEFFTTAVRIVARKSDG